jgi:2-aminoethylphosphonate-pyruvate transaminase
MKGAMMSEDTHGFIPDNPYLLLTPGPLSTSKGVRQAMLRDWCTWDDEYNIGVVQEVRRRLVEMGGGGSHTCVLLQGSGSFAVEATLATALGGGGRLLVVANGAYGRRMLEMARRLGIDHVALELPETEAPSAAAVDGLLAADPAISHLAMVHCETTTGILNPLEQVAEVARAHGRRLIVDAMSSFGGIPIDVEGLGVDYLISSSNKCIQGVPGFGFVLARRSELERTAGNARSLVLDLYDQWREMDAGGKWRFTSPTHVVRAFLQALDELAAEGGVPARHARYSESQRALASGMAGLGFQALIAHELQSPIITSFLYPEAGFDFGRFYAQMKERGFVLYPGKVSEADTFRIGVIGEVYPPDIARLLAAVADVRRG